MQPVLPVLPVPVQPVLRLSDRAVLGAESVEPPGGTEVAFICSGVVLVAVRVERDGVSRRRRPSRSLQVRRLLWSESRHRSCTAVARPGSSCWCEHQAGG